jgi:site-specific DNA-methyltransferase (adenine-specific)
MAVRIEDAGFEIRDMIAWVYGSGFPKSLDVSKAIDKAAGAEREVVGYRQNLCRTANRVDSAAFNGVQEGGMFRPDREMFADTAPATPAAKQWQGWGTALKPALEPITVARKPFTGTVAANVLEHGTGAINVDGCRVEAENGRPLIESKAEVSQHAFGNGLNGSRSAGTTTLGRWPANLIHDGSEEVVGLMGESSRFFYCAKASKADRDEGCEGMGEKIAKVTGMQSDQGMPMRMDNGVATGPKAVPKMARNHHPTVKPTDLMRYLCRLVTPPGGIVLDPFTGSGSTGKAAILEGFQFIGIEREAEYVEIARARIEHAINSKPNTLF